MKKVITIILLLMIGALCVSQLLPIKKEKKAKAHVLLGNGGTFDKDIYVVITSDSALSRDLPSDILKAPVEEISSNIAGITYYIDNRPIVIWLPKIPTTSDEYATFNHELMHAVHFLMDWAGVPLTISTGEVYAYEMEHLTKQFYEGIEKIKK